MTPDVTLLYPPGMTHRYGPEFEKAAKAIPPALFTPDTLPSVAHPMFYEVLPSDNVRGWEVTLHGVNALRQYRLDLGAPQLISARMWALPPDFQMLDRPGEFYNFNQVMELRFLLRPYDLPPIGPPFDPDTPPFVAVVWMHEPYLLGYDEQVHAVGRRLVMRSRTYRALGPRGLLPGTHDQHGFVMYQAWHRYLCGTSMVLDGSLPAFDDVVRQVYPTLF